MQKAIYFFASMGVLLSQAPVREMTGWSDLVTDITGIGALVVLLGFTLWKIIPQMTRDHAAAMNKQSEMYGELIRELKDSLESMEKTRHADCEALQNELENHRNAVQEMVRHCSAVRKG
jgi:hypothetical protein